MVRTWQNWWKTWLRSLLIALPGTLAGCKELGYDPFIKPTAIDPCDPVSNVYEGERHFIERSYIRDDGTIDYRKLFAAKDIQSSACDPVTGKKPEQPEQPSAIDRIDANDTNDTNDTNDATPTNPQ